MNILPGIGIGSIKYGITELELIANLGKPDKVIEEDEENRELYYAEKNLFFSFCQEDGFRLGMVTISGSGYPIFKKDIFGLSLKSVKVFLAKNTSEIPEYEEHINNNTELTESLNYNSMGILIWFESGSLTEMQCSYLFEPDNETIIWP